MQAEIVVRVHNALTATLVPTKKYLVACSGGADSLALTDAMQATGLHFAVGHVEHGLRGSESLHDAAFVQNFCIDRHLECLCEHVQVRAYCKERKTSLEEGARVLRWQALQKMAVNCGADFIVTAHQKDDQAETFLLRLLRGAGLKGLGGMRFTRDNILHPLLIFTGKELRQYCRERQIRWCEDSSNQDLSLTRNRIRHQLLPLLVRDYNPKIVETLVRTAAILQQDADFLTQAGRKATQICREASSKQQVVCNIKVWRTLPVALQYRVLQELWQDLDVERELSSANQEALAQICRQGVSGKKVMLPGGRVGLYGYDKLILAQQNAPVKEVRRSTRNITWDEIYQGTVIQVADGILQFQVVKGQPIPPGKTGFCYPWEQLLKLGTFLTLRTRLPGDIFFPYKGAGHKKLQDYFTDCKIPARDREQILLAAVGNTILWVSGRQGAGWHNLKTSTNSEWLRVEFKKGEKDHE